MGRLRRGDNLFDNSYGSNGRLSQSAAKAAIPGQRLFSCISNCCEQNIEDDFTLKHPRSQLAGNNYGRANQLHIQNISSGQKSRASGRIQAAPIEQQYDKILVNSGGSRGRKSNNNLNKLINQNESKFIR